MKTLKKVKEFNQAFGLEINQKPTLVKLDNCLLGAKLMKEEYQEYVDAFMQDDIVEIADAIVDMQYILDGLKLKHGISQECFDELFVEVHKSNMSKLVDGKPTYREDGKVLKGKDYFKPNLKPILDKYTLDESNMDKLNQIKSICDGIEYSRNIPDEAKKIAKENNIIVIVGGSDDLMYCYGTDSYLANNREHSYGWDGEDLTTIKWDKKLKKEAKQLGLKIWWCGQIKDKGIKIENYSVDESGAFSYSVNENIKHLNFKVMEDNDVYCTGIIIELPKNFKKHN